MHRTPSTPSSLVLSQLQYDTLPHLIPKNYFWFTQRCSFRIAYVGSDRPRTWDIVGVLPPIRMNIEPTTHYQLSGGPSADAEWAALAPNDGILHLGPHRLPYSISLFHQLRCLDIIRLNIASSSESTKVDDDSGSPLRGDNRLARHCLNYMRQMVLCRADLAVDPVLGRELEARVRPDTNQCVDWRRVYEELEKNQREYARWASESQHRVRNSFVHYPSCALKQEGVQVQQ